MSIMVIAFHRQEHQITNLDLYYCVYAYVATIQQIISLVKMKDKLMILKTNFMCKT